MKHMNDYDLAYAQGRFDLDLTPRRARLTVVVSNLADWADANSDGWAYWAKPRNAAQRAIALIESTTNAANEVQERTDATHEETVAAMRPIRAFMTRQGIPEGDIFP